MLGSTNINGGAGFDNRKALLKIKAPTGAIIVVSKNGYSKQIKNSVLAEDDEFSYWFFKTIDYGIWTISASNGIQTVTDTISITAIKQYDIILTYDLLLYNYGIYYTNFNAANFAAGTFYTNNYETYVSAGGTHQAGTYPYWRAIQKINLSNFNLLTIIYSAAVTFNYSYVRLSLQVIDEEGIVLSTTDLPNTPTTVNVDISSLDGFGYIQIATHTVANWSGGPQIRIDMNSLKLS